MQANSGFKFTMRVSPGEAILKCRFLRPRPLHSAATDLERAQKSDLGQVQLSQKHTSRKHGEKFMAFCAAELF